MLIVTQLSISFLRIFDQGQPAYDLLPFHLNYHNNVSHTRAKLVLYTTSKGTVLVKKIWRHEFTVHAVWEETALVANLGQATISVCKVQCHALCSTLQGQMVAGYLEVLIAWLTNSFCRAFAYTAPQGIPVKLNVMSLGLSGSKDTYSLFLAAWECCHQGGTAGTWFGTLLKRSHIIFGMKIIECEAMEIKAQIQRFYGF